MRLTGTPSSPRRHDMARIVHLGREDAVNRENPIVGTALSEPLLIPGFGELSIQFQMMNAHVALGRRAGGLVDVSAAVLDYP